MVSILGEGGVGKTRLSMAVAEAVAEDLDATPFVDGVWFVSCAAIAASAATQEQLAISIGAAVGIQFQGAKSAFEQLTDYIAKKAMLLIIDNFEHLEAYFWLLELLLQRAKSVQLLITSRHALGGLDERSIRLDGLEIPLFTENQMRPHHQPI